MRENNKHLLNEKTEKETLSRGQCCHRRHPFWSPVPSQTTPVHRHLSPPAVLFPDLGTSGDPHCAPPHGPPGATASCPFGPPSLLTPPLTACAPPRLLLSDPCPFPRALQPQGSRPQQGLHAHFLIPHSLCLSPRKCSCPQDPPTTRSPRSQLPKPKASAWVLLAQPSPSGLWDTPLPEFSLPLAPPPWLSFTHPSSTFHLLPWLPFICSLPLTPLPGRAHLFAGVDHCVLLGMPHARGSSQDVGAEVSLDPPTPMLSQQPQRHPGTPAPISSPHMESSLSPAA